jgi:flagellar biosynthetic protein FliP
MVAMTSSTETSPARKNLRFALHYVEMVIAMFVGMAVLGMFWSWAWPGLSELPAADALVMAADMTAGMAAWMLIRRHRIGLIVEMSVAMFLPFVILLAPYAFGVISGHAVMMGGHMLMFLTMLAAMLWRHHEYRH